VLVVSASERRVELQNALRESLGLPVAVTATFQEAITALSLSRYKAVILDEGLADLDPTNADRLLARCNDELPIFVKLAITGVQRCVQQVQLAIRRFNREQNTLNRSARHSIGLQLRDVLTSIVIHSQLALNSPGLAPDVVEHLNSVLQACDALQEVISPKPD
jgi:hypothetical protein